MKPVIFIATVLILSACSGRTKVPDNVIPQNKMYLILWDLSRADALINITIKDSTVDKKAESIKLYEQVFAIHNITREEFERSLDFYKRNPEILKVLMDSLRGYERRALLDTTRKESKLPVSDSNLPKRMERPMLRKDSIRNKRILQKPTN